MLTTELKTSDLGQTQIADLKVWITLYVPSSVIQNLLTAFH